MVPSMSRLANPYDNTSCESFIKTLKREEIYFKQYENLEHLRNNIDYLSLCTFCLLERKNHA
jgi:putative transposase